jgi:hypothetical protein
MGFAICPPRRSADPLEVLAGGSEVVPGSTAGWRRRPAHCDRAARPRPTRCGE